jgi:hypothetical protein
MFSTLEVFVHAGPVSLVAMSQLDWEQNLRKNEGRPSGPRRRLSIEVGPVRIRAAANSTRAAEIRTPALVSAEAAGKAKA